MSSVIGFSENLRIEMAVPRKRQWRDDDVDPAAVGEARVGQRRGLIDAAADLVDDPLGDLEQMFFVAELDGGELELALALDEGLVGAVDHDVADRGVGEQLFERAKAEQFIDQHLFERELLAPVEGDLELQQHLGNDRPEFLGQLVLVEHRRGFGIDPFEQARKHLFLDLVDRRLETLGLAAGSGAAGVLAGGQAVHCLAALAGVAGRGLELLQRRKLVAAGIVAQGPVDGALHRLGHAEPRACRRPADSAASTECAHSTSPEPVAEARVVNKGETFRKC